MTYRLQSFTGPRQHFAQLCSLSSRHGGMTSPQWQGDSPALNAACCATATSQQGADCDGTKAAGLTGQQLLRAAVQTPPLPYQLGARVEHFYLDGVSGLASELIATHLQIPLDIVMRLMWFGAVYSCPVVPVPPAQTSGGVDQETRARILAWREAGLKKHGKNPKLQAPRRMLQDVAIQGGAYFRLHLHPKRFPVACEVQDWGARLVHDSQEFVVVNKPPGLQVPPTVDNIRESLLAKVEEALGLEQGALAPPHRLDVGTEGLVVLTKNPSFARYFQALLKNKGDSVKKTYRCITANAPAVGPMVHHVIENVHAVGEPAHTVVFDEPVEGTCRAEMHLLKVEAVQLTGKAAKEWGPTAYECEILLVTGRTHQIRAQLSHVGCPLLGDELYRALHEYKSKSSSSHPLQHQQEQSQQSRDLTVSTEESGLNGASQQPGAEMPCMACASDVAASCVGSGSSASEQQVLLASTVEGSSIPWHQQVQGDPLRPFGLQAAKLEILEDGPMGAAPVAFEAGVPWWRTL